MILNGEDREATRSRVRDRDVPARAQIQPATRRALRSCDSRNGTSRPITFRAAVERLENRLTLTGNIVLVDAFAVGANGNTLTTASAGTDVYVEATFTTEGLPSDASYRVGYTVNGLTIDSPYVVYGAGGTETQSFTLSGGPFLASPGTNQVTVTVDPDESVPETSYADNTSSFSFSGSLSSAGALLSYSVSQIRNAYGLNSINPFPTGAADGSGQTIAIVNAFDDPTILTDLNGFDEAMHMSSNSSPTLCQAYGPASSILSVFNQSGRNITPDIGEISSSGVPAYNGTWEGEETGDVEWAHAIAPGAHIDLIECKNSSVASLFAGAALAAQASRRLGSVDELGQERIESGGERASRIGFRFARFRDAQGPSRSCVRCIDW